MNIEIELAAPAFLIAVPQLSDPHFHRGVVFMVEHDDQGSMGLLINRPSNLPLGVFCASQDMVYAGCPNAWVYHGGPVHTHGAFALHTGLQPGLEETVCLTDTMRLSCSVDALRCLMQEPPEHIRVFLGYAGWGPQQLARELSRGAWLVGTPSEQLVFETPAEDVWEAALHEMGIEAMQLLHSGAIH